MTITETIRQLIQLIKKDKRISNDNKRLAVEYIEIAKAYIKRREGVE